MDIDEKSYQNGLGEHEYDNAIMDLQPRMTYPPKRSSFIWQVFIDLSSIVLSKYHKSMYNKLINFVF